MSHSCAPIQGVDPSARKVVLAGNPNVGKSALFHGLTGVYVEVSNYPGTTVDLSAGRLGDAALLDTPGIYGVSSFQDEDRVAKEVILHADAAVWSTVRSSGRGCDHAERMQPRGPVSSLRVQQPGGRAALCPLPHRTAGHGRVQRCLWRMSGGPTEDGRTRPWAGS